MNFKGLARSSVSDFLVRFDSREEIVWPCRCKVWTFSIFKTGFIPGSDSPLLALGSSEKLFYRIMRRARFQSAASIIFHPSLADIQYCFCFLLLACLILTVGWNYTRYIFVFSCCSTFWEGVWPCVQHPYCVGDPFS